MTDTELARRLARSTRKTAYFAKDLEKAQRATRFIGQGSPRSSTHAYRVAAGDLANCGTYSADDRVFVSAEGNRRGRLPPDWTELGRATAAGATLIADVPADRRRDYNIGEREVADWLTRHGYIESAPGTWTPGDDRRERQAAPRVVHCKRDPYDVYIGRGRCPRTGTIGTWGNPFVIGNDGDRETVIRKHREWLLNQPELVARAKRELRGKTLGCWCAPHHCHGDTLAEIANDAAPQSR